MTYWYIPIIPCLLLKSPELLWFYHDFPTQKTDFPVIFPWFSHQNSSSFPPRPSVAELLNGPRSTPGCYEARTWTPAASLKFAVGFPPCWSISHNICIFIHIYIYGTPPKISGSKFAIVRSYVLDMNIYIYVYIYTYLWLYVIIYVYLYAMYYIYKEQ